MPSRTLLSGCRVVTDAQPARRADVLMEGGKIRAVAPGISPRGARVIRARGLLAIPGLIDTQVNGGFGLSFSAATPAQVVEVGRRLLVHGVTAYLPTLISLPRAQTLRALSSIVEAARLGEGARILGIHMEGPFLSPEKRGAHRRENLRRPSRPEFLAYVRAAEGMLRMMTIAPELPGALAVIREGRRRGVLMSCGHSMASAAEVASAVRKGGLRHVTHVFNAMAPLHHRDGSILNEALLSDALSCGMIYDREHLSASTAGLLVRLKPRDGLVLVSDMTAALGASDGEYGADGERYVVRRGRVIVKGTGRLAGSACSQLEGVNWLAQDGVLPFHEAVYLATGAPAALLGLRGRKGTLRPGADADVVLLDGKGRVRMAFTEGEVRHGSRH